MFLFIREACESKSRSDLVLTPLFSLLISPLPEQQTVKVVIYSPTFTITYLQRTFIQIPDILNINHPKCQQMYQKHQPWPNYPPYRSLESLTIKKMSINKLKFFVSIYEIAHPAQIQLFLDVF
ncbi:MAG: hypothetical protein EZS28_047013 [Streblomastix strix]|uniref:Uncharacterized protein n=1 Tax=Streblomastix strix TaxID=222440 RepID=A0A5J4TI89_9EUKA|nr:MAG: hypothetical protein EZS28_047013 [Streblomastix strix]